MSPIHNPLARESFGVLPEIRLSQHEMQICSECLSNTGLSNVKASLFLEDFLFSCATTLCFSQVEGHNKAVLKFTSLYKTVSDLRCNSPQTLHATSSTLSLEKLSHQPVMIRLLSSFVKMFGGKQASPITEARELDIPNAANVSGTVKRN